MARPAMASTRREMRRPQSRSASASPAARVATRRSRASRSPRRMRTITDVPVSEVARCAAPATDRACRRAPPARCRRTGGAPRAAGAGPPWRGASASSHAASDSRASWQPASAFSAEIRAASASADRRSRAGSWARSSALPASRMRWASRTAPLSSLILGQPGARGALGVVGAPGRGRSPPGTRRGGGPSPPRRGAGRPWTRPGPRGRGGCRRRAGPRAGRRRRGGPGRGRRRPGRSARRASCADPRTAPRQARAARSAAAGIGHARGPIGGSSRRRRAQWASVTRGSSALTGVHPGPCGRRHRRGREGVVPAGPLEPGPGEHRRAAAQPSTGHTSRPEPAAAIAMGTATAVAGTRGRGRWNARSGASVDRRPARAGTGPCTRVAPGRRTARTKASRVRRAGDDPRVRGVVRDGERVRATGGDRVRRDREAHLAPRGEAGAGGLHERRADGGAEHQAERQERDLGGAHGSPVPPGSRAHRVRVSVAAPVGRVNLTRTAPVVTGAGCRRTPGRRARTPGSGSRRPGRRDPADRAPRSGPDGPLRCARRLPAW